ncbi:hypothetical protein L7F22_041279 [Adiantum nelumboides]|nr:hypothetical protein [Adiantum nelumboides]
MVLNFFQLRNNTPFTFQLINSENSGDNYNVGPYDSTSHHDMWLAQGDGAKGVSVLTFCDGSAISPLLHMWDQDWGIHYRIGGQTWARSISVNGNKDFSIEMDNNSIRFVCNGSFNSSESSVTVLEWKDLITNFFENMVSDANTLDYAQQFAPDSARAKRDVMQLVRESGITRPTDTQIRAITNLVAMWEDDYLEANRRQGTLYSDGSGWRIDLQDNGAVQRHGMHFYNIAVQYGSGRDNVFAHILLPVGYLIGRRRIRNAILQSMRTSTVMVVIPPQEGLSFVQGIAYNSERARTSWGIRSLQWECTDTSNAVWR